MVTPSMSVAHIRTLLADVDVIQGPLVLLSVVVLDPAEPCCAGPEHRKYTNTITLHDLKNGQPLLTGQAVVIMLY